MSSHRRTLDLARCFSESAQAYHRNLLTFFLAALATYVLSLCSLFILAGPLEAGFTMMILQAIRGQEEVNLRDLFKYFNRFGRLFMLSLVTTVATLGGGAFFLLPGLLIGAWWLYVYPLAADRDLRFGDSLRESFRIVNRSGLWIHVALFVVVLAIGTGGPLLARKIGFVLTCVLAPFATGLVASGYHQICDE